MSKLGCGTWTAQIASRGGTPTLYELNFSGLSVTRTLNSTGNGRIDGNFRKFFSLIEPWRDELLLFRDETLVFAGPIQTVNLSEIFAQDLFVWMDVRFLEEDFHGDGDVSDIYMSIFEQAYEKDDSPNISISTRRTGIEAVRDFKGVEFRKAGDVLRELARTGLDYTMNVRQILAGGTEIFLSDTPLIVHDDGISHIDPTKEGTTFATDVAVFGSSEEVGDLPFTGRAARLSDTYGLIQRSFTELDIRDTPSADANALARLESMQPAPLRLKITLSKEAAFDFVDIICGRRVEVHLSEAAGYVDIDDTLRLLEASVKVSISENGQNESVDIQLIPLGVAEDA